MNKHCDLAARRILLGAGIGSRYRQIVSLLRPLFLALCVPLVHCGSEDRSSEEDTPSPDAGSIARDAADHTDRSLLPMDGPSDLGSLEETDIARNRDALAMTERDDAASDAALGAPPVDATAADGSASSDTDQGSALEAGFDVHDGGDVHDAGDGAAECVSQTIPQPARAARSAGFSGTANTYYTIFETSCQSVTQCSAPCVNAGGTEASCAAGSACLGEPKHCVPTAYWLYTDQAVSESGETATAAALVLADMGYHDALVLTDFGLDLPAGASIRGIQFQVRRSALDGWAVDDAVRVAKKGALTGIDHRQSSAWPTELTYATYGGPNDTWGITWTPADLRGDGFGIAVAPRFTNGEGTSRAYLESARVTVFFDLGCE